MLEVLTRYWWALALRGVAALVFGVLAVIWPEVTVIVLLVMFGAYALVDGIFALGTAIVGRRDTVAERVLLVVQGITGILAGILTFVWPGMTTLVLLWLIAGWAIITGVLGIAAAIRLRREIAGEWLLATGGVLSVLFGVLLIVWPAAGALAVVVLIGFYAIAYGIVLLFLGLRLRKLRREGQVSGAHRAAIA